MPEYRKFSVAEITYALKSIEALISPKQRADLKLLYETPSGFSFERDGANRIKEPNTAHSCSRIGKEMMRVLAVPQGDGMMMVGDYSNESMIWFMNEKCRSALDVLGWFGPIIIDPLVVIQQELSARVELAMSYTSTARRRRLANAPNLPNKVQVLTYAYIRNADVVAEALFRARGKCESCGKDAPFLKSSNQQPYLEVHHRIQLAAGGEDTLANVIAVCPNCHRFAHYG
jgi:5-methylcytosine-specific restriction endonuclease McrA